MMIKKIILLSFFFFFISSTVVADEIYRKKVVKVNGLLMYSDVAHKILKAAKDSGFQYIHVDPNSKEIDVSINGFELMDTIASLYFKALSDQNKDKNIVCEIGYFEGKKVVAYIHKEKKVLDSLIISED